MKIRALAALGPSLLALAACGSTESSRASTAEAATLPEIRYYEIADT